MKEDIVKVSEEQVLSEDGVLLNYYHWVPEKSKAAVLISHGWSEHAGRYHDVANWFAARGFEVHALDHRGHGKSGGPRGHVHRWSDYARDLEQLRQSVNVQPQYLLGHSMGGMIGVLHLLEYPGCFAAVALSGPAADVSIPIPKVKVFLGKTMSNWMPTLSMSNDIDPSVVCSDKKVVEAYINDPFTHGKVSVRWFSEYMKTIERVKRNAGKISTPTAIWHGEGDTLVEPWVSENLYHAFTMKDRQRALVGNALHEILLEPDWQQTADEIKLWMERF